jgi:hypothetical protein
MQRARLLALATPAAFIALLGLLAGLGAITADEAWWFAFAVVVGFGPSGAFAPGGWRRRGAEALLLPVAAVAVLVGEPVMRLVALAPLVFLATWAAAAAWIRAQPDRAPLAAAGLGAAGLAVSGMAMDGAAAFAAAGAVVGSVIVPWCAARVFGRHAGVLAACLAAALPLQQWPLVSFAVTMLAVVWALFWRRWSLEALAGWQTAFGAAALIGLSIAPWGGLGVRNLLPGASWVSLAAVAATLLVALRLPPAAASAGFVLASLLMGPPLPPTPEGGRLELSADQTAVRLPRPGDGGSYQLQVALRDGERVGQGATVAWVKAGDVEVPLRVGENVAEWRTVGDEAVSHGPAGDEVWRVAGRPGGPWSRAARVSLEVGAGEHPVMRRNPGIRKEATVFVAASGPERSTPPRDWPAEQLLWAAAALVALFQLGSGRWMASTAGLPWLLVLTGVIATRCAVEPHRLLLERWGVDLVLAAVLAAWLPAALFWLKRRRRFVAAASLLVPIALVMPHLTPPLWGDEPYHLALLESAVADGDLDLTNQLDPDRNAAAGHFLAAERFFHSPVLAALLFPGFWLAGRTGALFLLALAGAGVVALSLGPAARRLGLRRHAVGAAAVLAVVSMPLATFSSQIWAEVPGALALAVALALPVAAPWGRVAGVVAAVVATAIKTRLALILFPAALAHWWRGDRRQRMIGAAVAAGGAMLALGAGWILMGHPFGLYRRVHHLLPTDLRQAMTTVGGLVFDVAGGMAWSAPLWLVALLVLPRLWRRGDVRVQAAMLGGAATVAALLHSFEWYGGGSPAARYLVPMLPVVLLAWAELAGRPDGRRRLLVALIPAALLPWWALVTRPHFSINPGDGRWWLTNALSRRFEADARSLFPSFLVPTPATIVVPVLLVAIGALAWWWLRRGGRARLMLRVAPAVWLLAVGGMVATLELRHDTVVEAEAAQVRRDRGAPVPPVGTPSRSRTPNGWRLADGHGLTFPLRVGAGDRVRVEGWTAGSGSGTALKIGWENGPTELVPITPVFREHGLVGPPAPAAGRQLLRLQLTAPARGETLVVDRVVVE